MAQRDVAIIGGSIGGLSAAIALLRNLDPKPRVTAFERSTQALEDRGAGLAISLGLYSEVTGDTDLKHLVYERHRFSRSEMLNAKGQPVSVDFHTPADQPRKLWRGTVSYDNIMSALLPTFTALGGTYVRGKRVLRVEPGGDKSTVVFEDGTSFRADLIVGADGYMSDLRTLLLGLYPPSEDHLAPPPLPPSPPSDGLPDFHTLLPASRPRYDNLIIFRGLVERSQMPAGMYESILPDGCGNFNVFYDRREKLYWGCYPVPPFRKSADRRARFNWFMYLIVPNDVMVRTLTDRNGERHLYSLPPGTIDPRVAQEFLAFAKRDDVLGKWPKVVEMLELTVKLDKLFAQAVWSYSPTRTAFPKHRTILIGDAAALASPTTTTGTQRCFDDALALVRALKEGDGTIEDALEKSEKLRVQELREIVARGVRRVSSLQPFYHALVAKL
ncbi:hypothetical protein DFJ74DRAFT_697368 [Hyaloraphidium curvatum]|nr:hypothetical protein DFJ74DRAFT_697368 [Hyaloraphidium curvatum]